MTDKGRRAIALGPKSRDDAGGRRRDAGQAAPAAGRPAPRLRFAAAAAVAAAVASGWPSAAQTLLGDARQGEHLAQALCADCHRIGRNAEPDDWAPSFEQIANRPSTTELSLRVFLRSPHVDMPDLVLSESEIDDVAAYILGLR